MDMETKPEPLLPLLRLPTATHRIRWSGLHGCLTGLAIAQAVEAHPGAVIVITTDTPESYQLQTEIGFFLGSQEQHPLIHYPDWETLPYDNFSPHQDIISDRLHTLYQLDSLQHGVLVAPITTILARTPSRAHIVAAGLQFEVGQRIALDQICLYLTQAGYVRTGQVMEHGEFALRGSLLDLFATGSKTPVRIDLLDDEIESMRHFDPDTQRTTTKAGRVRLLPARECPLNTESIAHFRAEWRSRFEGDPNRCPIYQEVSQGIASPGIEYYLPLFFDQCSSVLEQLPTNALIIFTAGAENAATEFWKDLRERYENRRHDQERPILPPGDLFLSVDAVFKLAKSYPRVQITATSDQSPDDNESAVPISGFSLGKPLAVMPMADNPYALLQQFLADYPGRTLFLAESPGRRQILQETLSAHEIHAQLFADWHSFVEDDAATGITVAPLERGAILPQPLIALITEPQLFGSRTRQQRRNRSNRDAEAIVRDLNELHSGAPVVHEHYGVGRYQGLQTLNIGDTSGEFLCLTYADDDKLYVPVLSLHLISRYTGADPESAPMHALGGTQWEKARRKAAQKAHDVAAELLDVQARRESRNGYSYAIDLDELRVFENAFPFAETPDQATCIQTVYADLAAAKPMDRLVCGDVGFGKTEIAMRAAFVVAYGGKQTAILVPTTLLAQQHFQTFCDRFADWPIRIAQLSRFRTASERSQVLADLEQGRLDIVIGTHQLLQNSVRFHRLGLVIIDEEHRFGVRQKERLKQLRAESDVLTLTATPIPRTLNMAISGLRDLSLMATAPAGRLSIQTFVREWDDGLIREGLQREIRRGGQVFFVHNRVQSIKEFAAKVERLLPEAVVVRIAHGQMHERDLERTMMDFYHRRFQVLICTTIIETGIDIPNANTIFVHRADRYGLAQLHQLRGRVGRSHHRAYAYLLIPPRRAMTANARKRLEAIAALEDLGIGFTLATHDMEIRGVGDLLGEGQSGQINEVGYSMYTRLLEHAVTALQSGRNPTLERPLDDGIEIDLHITALIPADYLADVNARLILYKRIASAKDAAALEDLRVEMIDRFGALPDPLHNLFHITELKLQVNPLGIRKIDANHNGARLIFFPHTTVSPKRIVELIQTAPDRYRLEGGNRLRIQGELPDVQARLQAVQAVVDHLGNG